MLNFENIGAAVVGRLVGTLSPQITLPHDSLTQLELLWMVSVQVLESGLAPVHELLNLSSLRTTFKTSSVEFRELCAAVPTLKHCKPIG